MGRGWGWVEEGHPKRPPPLSAALVGLPGRPGLAPAGLTAQ